MNYLKSKTQLTTSLLLLLFLNACYEFDFLDQPNTADPNSFFEVYIHVDPPSSNDTLETYFGILMPSGWTTTDSIEYLNTYTNATGVWIHSKHFTKIMTAFDPPPENYYWWVGTASMNAEPNTEFSWYPKIYTNDQNGTFFIDYMIGDSRNGINFKRSNNNLINVGDVSGCFLEGITFTSQYAIDNFASNYPNCTEIAGNVTIRNVTSLSGLNMLTAIGGNVTINSNEVLPDFSGLENLLTIGGSLIVYENSGLLSLSGLDNITSIGKDLWIEGNPALSTIAMPESIGPVGENLVIIDNDALTSLKGLEKVNSLGGCLRIEDNGALINLSGLNYLTSIASGIIIRENESLATLSALNNLSSPLAWDLTIVNNFSLVNLSGLGNIASLGGSLSIEGNASLTGLTDFKYLSSIGGDIYIGGRLFISGGNPALLNLSGLDHLISIGGTLRIEGNESLNSLTGLENLISIGQDMIIGNGYMGISSGYYWMGNPALINMTGLDNLVSIGRSLEIHCNDSLISLNGLENLATVGKDLKIGIMVNPRNGGPYYLGNPSLVDLTALSTLASIGGDIDILGNDVLPSLAGMDNIDPGTIANLDMTHNDSLSTCEVQSICEYLVAPNGVVTIHTNNSGCNSPPEVAQGCGNTMPCLTQGVYYLFDQTHIDSFQVYYPGCTKLEVDVMISGDNITNLEGLSVVTSIDGNLEIVNNPDLVDLLGLDNVESISGSLGISNNSSLTSLTGLESLAEVEGDVHIGYGPDGNSSLGSFSGLQNLTSIGGGLYISRCGALTDLSGLDKLVFVGGDLNFFDNNYLTSLNGLNKLESIGGHLEVFHNSMLHNLIGLDSLSTIGGAIYAMFSGLHSFTGLENLTTIGGYMDIRWNNSLISLSGFDNIDPASISSLQIKENPSLCTCEVQSMCDFLINYNGVVHLGGNGSGCNNKYEIIASCYASCLPEGILFSTQEEIDDFQFNHPGCTSIEGDVTIQGINITNLEGVNVLSAVEGNLYILGNHALVGLTGLNDLIYVGGDLNISGNDILTQLTGFESLSAVGDNLILGMTPPTGVWGNPSLASLTGLDNLATIGGDFKIVDQASLVNFTGLENLVSIGGSLQVGLFGSPMGGYGNPSLESFDGLNSLSAINGDVQIMNNPSLTSLSGLETVSAFWIDNLNINTNDTLSTCEAQSICDYLASPNGTIEIYDNAMGCNSIEEVMYACDPATMVPENFDNKIFTISPNPCSGAAHLKLVISEPACPAGRQELVIGELYTMSGIKIRELVNEKMLPGTYEMEIDLRDLPAGIYYCVLRTNAGNYTTKLIKI